MDKRNKYVPIEGDYVEGIEVIIYPNKPTTQRIMRGWVGSVFGENVHLQADDSFNGNRGTRLKISTLRRLSDRVPEWWKTVNRRLPDGTEVMHFKGKRYKILTHATEATNGAAYEVVVYQALYGNQAVYVRDAIEFYSVVDHEKYPDITQQYRFEEVSST